MSANRDLWAGGRQAKTGQKLTYSQFTESGRSAMLSTLNVRSESIGIEG